MEGLCSGKNVCSVLNFEHPYFMDRTLINKLNRIIGKRESVQVYANGSGGPHSLFYRVAKDNEESCFKRLIKEDQQYLHDLRNKIPYGCYIMSGHVKTQRLLADPIIASKVIGILDNADSKENQFLYGFPNMKIAKPSVDNVHCVITSHMGPYQAEINQQLLAINPLVVLL
jgi:hypothetical protein